MPLCPNVTAPKSKKGIVTVEVQCPFSFPLQGIIHGLAAFYVTTAKLACLLSTLASSVLCFTPGSGRVVSVLMPKARSN